MDDADIFQRRWPTRHGEPSPDILAGQRETGGDGGLDDVWGDVGKSQMHKLQIFLANEAQGKLLTFTHRPLNNYGELGEEATPR